MEIQYMYTQVINKIKNLPTTLYIFLFAFLYRLPSLGVDFINNDAFLWKSRSYEFGKALMSLDFAKTAVTYHPGIPLLWSQFIAIKIYSLLDFLIYKGVLSPNAEFITNHIIQKTVLVFFTSVLVALAFFLLKKIIGQRSSILVIMFVLLEPFYLGLSRAIHTDTMISLFMFISCLYFYIAFSKDNTIERNGKEAILSGVFIGLAALTKSSALFLIPFYVLGYLILRRFDFSEIKKLLIVYLFFILSFFAFWPAMWVNPVGSLNLYLFKGVEGVALEEGHGHIWFGVETLDPGPLFYPIAFVSRYSMFMVLMFVFGIYFSIKNFKRKYKFNINLIYWFAFIAFYFLMLTFVSKKLDRYLLPITFPVAIFSVYWIRNYFSKKVLALIFSLFVFGRFVILFGLHPNYLAYYSQLVGGMENGRTLIEPKWLIAYDKVALFFNSDDEPEKVKVAIADFDYLRPFAKFEVLNIRVEEERNKADYFVLPVYREERNKFYLDSYNLEKLNDVITVSGVEYYQIYKSRGKK
ncbi:hypothetical protein COV25_00370 [candidate division WWE3 bacterium CG10_big_fil_rev_8_21_14_0_10_35_32]|nr:MAG: hypothetical protein COV25_00370 [candidate division WWE3 bacterium CG10_big_fil_rev_8_21_14_0_10_35_32]